MENDVQKMVMVVVVVKSGCGECGVGWLEVADVVTKVWKWMW